ncbi:hypothetical protein BDR26DRAFT_710079 [Obelidium mucronatum]|nr:hypothetical protein BDR26DRAFT_710079 [Obelidium mucronatum]
MDKECEAQPLLRPRQPSNKARQTKILSVVLLLILLTFVTWRSGATPVSVVASSKPSKDSHQPIAGSFEFHPSLYKHITVLVELKNENTNTATALQKAKLPQVSTLLMVDPGTSQTSHAAYEISSSHESAQIESAITAAVDLNGVLTIRLILDDSSASFSQYSRRKPPPRPGKTPWLHASIRLTLPQETIASFHFLSQSERIESSLVWEAETKVEDSFMVQSLGTHSSVDKKVAAPSIKIKSDTYSNSFVVVVAGHLGIQVDAATAGTQALLKSQKGDIVATVSGKPNVNAETDSGVIQLKLDHNTWNSGIQMENHRHETTAKSQMGHVKCTVLGFKGKFAAQTEEGVVEVSLAKKKGEVIKFNSTAGWIGGENGKGLFEAVSKKGNVALLFL